MKKLDITVDEFINTAPKWREEFAALRRILLEFPLTEELKWGVPTYSVQGKNVVLMHGFKEYCALLFVKGALMSDPQGILISQTENTQSSRQIRFTGLPQIAELAPAVRAYISEAIELEKAGVKVEYKKTEEFAMPDEFRVALDKDPALQKAFSALTPGRQRGYLLHFCQPKQSKTREARVDKCRERILSGKGLDDR